MTTYNQKYSYIHSMPVVGYVLWNPAIPTHNFDYSYNHLPINFVSTPVLCPAVTPYTGSISLIPIIVPFNNTHLTVTDVPEREYDYYSKSQIPQPEISQAKFIQELNNTDEHVSISELNESYDETDIFQPQDSDECDNGWVHYNQENINDKRLYQRIAAGSSPKRNTSMSDIAKKPNACLLGYDNLPKDLFPAAREFQLDPNPIIEQFFNYSKIQKHIPWLLDLEFGIPKVAVTRPIPIYDVRYNSIHCKNAPDAIHPSFEKCSAEFKRQLTFYYDCIVSTWYLGYVKMTNDVSVENFQSWLQVPLQAYGFCWP